MEPQELPVDVAKKLADWLGQYSVLHFWERAETTFIVARTPRSPDLYMIRIFPVGDKLELSQDNVIYEILAH